MSTASAAMAAGPEASGYLLSIGPAFLWSFLVLAMVALVRVSAVRGSTWRWQARRHPGLVRPGTVSPVEVAYLRGGRLRAALVALASVEVHGLGRFEPGPWRGGWAVVHPWSSDHRLGAHPLERAALMCCTADPDLRRAVGTLYHGATMQSLESDLTARGLIPDDELVARLRRGTDGLGALAGLGAFGVMIGLVGNEPIGAVAALLLATLAALLALRRRPRRTRVGAAVLRDHRPTPQAILDAPWSATTDLYRLATVDAPVLRQIGNPALTGPASYLGAWPALIGSAGQRQLRASRRHETDDGDGWDS